MKNLPCRAEAQRRLVAQLERDIAQTARNQILIDRMKTVTRKDRLMLAFHRYNWIFAAGAALCFLFWCVVFARADEPRFQCPNVGEPCKVLTLNPQEERALTGPNGVLDTAAQGRAIELGQFAVYLKQRLATAPQGEVKQPPAPPAPEPKKEVDKP